MKSLYSLRKYLIRYKKYLLIGLLFIVLSNVFKIVIPPIIRDTINALTENASPAFFDLLPVGVTSYLGVGVIALLLVLGFALLNGICLFFMRMTIIIMSRHIEYDQKNDIFKKYQSLGQRFYAQNYTGDLMNRISEDVSRVRMFTGPAIMYTLNLTCMIIMVVSLMFYVNVEITLYVLMPLPVLALTIYLVSDAMNKKSDLIQRKLSDLTSYVQETFAGIHVVKSYAAERDFARDFEEMNEDYKAKNMALVKINGIFMPAVLGLVGLSILITVYAGGNAVVRGEFTLGNIVEYVIYVNMLTWPVASLGYVTSLVQRGAASQARINEFMQEKEAENTGTLALDSLQHGIQFIDVWFKYPDTDKWVLQDLSFTIESNQKFGIIGTTGSGKTTIAKLLVGVFRPTKGQIRVDGKPIEEYNKTELNKLFGYVAQDIFLFSATLEQNILFGINSATDSANLETAVDAASLAREVSSFPKGLQTMLGERGVTLSGGQKQRTAIARALIKQPEILLIDDGLSAVDTKTEVHIKNKLKVYAGLKTFINISHRISSVQDASHIIFMDESKIVEQGTHEDLMAIKGWYADLYEKQMTLDEIQE